MLSSILSWISDMIFSFVLFLFAIYCFLKLVIHIYISISCKIPAASNPENEVKIGTENRYDESRMKDSKSNAILNKERNSIKLYDNRKTWKECTIPKNEVKIGTESRYDESCIFENNGQILILPREIVKDSKSNAILDSGDKGEELLKSTIENFEELKDYLVIFNKRLHVRDGLPGIEIDLIVISNNYIYIFESKAYKGYIIKNPDPKSAKKKPYIRLIPKNGDIAVLTQIDDLSEKIERYKEDILLLLNMKGIEVQPDRLKSLLVITEPSTRIDPDISDSELVSINKILEKFSDDINEEDKYKMALIALLRFCLSKEESYHVVKSAEFRMQRQKIYSILNLLPGWDHITFFGGHRIRCDIHKLSGCFLGIPEWLNLSKARLTVLLKLEERNIDYLKKRIACGYLVQVEVQNQEGRSCMLAIKHDAHIVKAHEAGKEFPHYISLYNIETIDLKGRYNPKEL